MNTGSNAKTNRYFDTSLWLARFALTSQNLNSFRQIQAIVSNNNVVPSPFQLHTLTFSASGPASGTAPTYTIHGSQLQFINDGVTNPTMTFNAGGSIRPVLTISNGIALANTLTVNAITGATLSGVVRAPIKASSRPVQAPLF
jgi:hypothetical protein